MQPDGSWIMWMRSALAPAQPPMLTEHEPLLVNAVGHIAGTIIFSIFLALALKGGAGRRSRQNLLSIASAGLAWFWNAGSFATLVFPPGPVHWTIEALSFCSLSLLPAVLLQVSLNGRFRFLARIAYLLSFAATAMHLSEGLLPGLHLHGWALSLIALGFGSLTVIYAASLLREGKHARGGTSQILAAMGLLLFAVTFSHFGAERQPKAWTELLLHHAGIPVALLILLRDYRFVFLDAFVRFLANVILAAGLAYTGMRAISALPVQPAPPHPLSGIFAVAGLCGLLILFAWLRGIVQRLLTRAVFQRTGAETAARDLRSQSGEIGNESQYLSWAAERLAAVVRAPRFEILDPEAGRLSPAPLRKDLDYPSLVGDEPTLSRDPRWNWVEAVVPIRLSQQDVRCLLLGRRHGGRRYLSEDLRALNYLSTIVAEEVERFRLAEMKRLVSEAELRALHSQINPHFLFNALNTIYGIIPREAVRARHTVLNLADIFRYFLQSDKILIPLAEELKIVTAYLEIERLRLGSRLETMIDVDPEAEHTLIPILSVQPLVENAIKHGVSMRPDKGWLRLSATVSGSALTIIVEDSGTGAAAKSAHPASAGIGLANVTRRLQLCFGGEAGIEMQQGDFGTKVQFSVPRAAIAAHQS